MNNFLKYLRAQGLRAINYYPIVLLFTVLLTFSLVLLASKIMEKEAATDSKNRIEVGLVGDLSESYLDIGILALKNMDSSRFYVELTEMEEEEAKEKLMKGELYGYVLIPEGFVESVVTGENKSLTYVAANSPATLGPVLMHEIVQIVSRLVIQGQNGIYGMMEIADYYVISDEAYDHAVVDLNIKYIDAVLDREKFYELTYVGLGNGLSFQEYYICALLILLLMLWGLTCSGLLIKTSASLSRLLRTRGYHLPGMILGEYIPFLTIIAVNTFLLVGLERFLWVLPVVIMLTAMQFLLYEISSDVISGVLSQIFVIIFISYASGLFYPIYSLPNILQKLGKFLPTRVAFEHLSSVLKGQPNSSGMLWICTTVFLGLAMIVRLYKMRSNKYD